MKAEVSYDNTGQDAVETMTCADCGVAVATSAPQAKDAKVYCEKCAPRHAGTKFWFCESCGKRVTDKEIEDGLGRDKKLKGVYCKSCGVGVMTIEFDAVKLPIIEPARNVTATPRHKPPEEHPKRGPAVRQAAAKKEGIPASAMIAAAVGIVVITFAALMLSPQKPAPVAKSDAPQQAPTPPQPEIPQTVNPPATPPAAPSPPVEPAPTPAPAPVAPEKPVEPPSAEPNDPVVASNPVVATQPPVESPPTAPVDKPNPPTGEAPPRVDQVATPEPVATEPKAANKEDEEQRRQQMDSVRKTIAPLLRQNQFANAEKHLDERLRDAAFAGIAEMLKQEKADLAEIRALRERAIEALKQKKGAIRLRRQNSVVSGTAKVDPGRPELTILTADGAEMVFRADQLSTQDIETYLPVEAGANASELKRRALLLLAAGEHAQAEKYFIRARDAGGLDAVAPYLERLKRLGDEAKEAAAAEAWKAAEALIERKSWSSAKQAYKKFSVDFAGTAFAAEHAKPLAQRFDAIDEALGPPRAISIDLGGGVKLDLQLIPAGSFEMGGDGSPEKPRPVKISRMFYMGKYEVTQAQFEKVLGLNNSRFKGDTLPAENVTYNQALEFCKKVSALCNRTVRLPTEAEWEYACRAGTKTIFNSGDNDAALDPAGWFNGNSDMKTRPVGQKKPNAWGLYDMHGNVWEWCQDWFATDYPRTPAEDPQGPAQGAGRVLRGGSYGRHAVQCQSGSRATRTPNDHGDSGMRVVLSFVPLK